MYKPSLFATDLDGTLLRSDGSFCGKDITALVDLQQKGCSVVLATGRSPFSLKRCLGETRLPVDWFVLSSGTGILDVNGSVVYSNGLTANDTEIIHRAFVDLGVNDLFIQAPFPDAHLLHWMKGEHCADFHRRLSYYNDYSRQIVSPKMPSSELIGLVPPEIAAETVSALENAFENKYSVVRATSPIDLHTVWIEVFAAGVNKASACEFIRNKVQISLQSTAAVGNDWNDVHMLRWASRSFISVDGPGELIKEFENVPSSDNSAVAVAAEIWQRVIS